MEDDYLKNEKNSIPRDKFLELIVGELVNIVTMKSKRIASNSAEYQIILANIIIELITDLFDKNPNYTFSLVDTILTHLATRQLSFFLEPDILYHDCIHLHSLKKRCKNHLIV